MLKNIVLLAFTTAVVAVSNKLQTTEEKNVADKEFLVKQKAVFDILYHYSQPELDEKLYKIGQSYDLKANIDSFNDKKAVEDLLTQLEFANIPPDATFSVLYYRDDILAVYKVLFNAKDFNTFYNASLYLRNRINHDMFAYAFYYAVIHRPDTEYIRLPHLYEIMPYMFYNTELRERARKIEQYGIKEINQYNQTTYVLPYKYSGWYLYEEFDNNNFESLVNYLLEDISWNEHYFFFRSEYPFFTNSQEFGKNNSFRGENYLYGHKQVLSKYFLERIMHGLSTTEHFDYYNTFYPGYNPAMTYPNGLPFPVRPWNSKFQLSRGHSIWYNEQYERRIFDALDSGHVLNADGNTVPLYTSEGLNILGNIIEGNADSVNSLYYGEVDKNIRSILSYNVQPLGRFQSQPSALEQFTMCLRDPAIYRIYFRLLHWFQKYQQHLGAHKREAIQFPEFKIEQVKTDKLVTFFEDYDSDISKGLLAPSKEAADSLIVKVRQRRLNNKPFNINITVNSKKATKAAIKIFIGPKYDTHGREIYFADVFFDLYYQIDNFVTDLKAGVNNVVCNKFFLFNDEKETSDEYYRRVVKALENDETFEYQKRIYSFPKSLILPLGKPEGRPMRLFVHVAPLVGEPLRYKSRVFGESVIDNRPLGYPLNRPIIERNYQAPNIILQDIKIYHIDN